jgi:mRNA-degrading endonuclease RelE of RelBE toxin-antitoxin system
MEFVEAPLFSRLIYDYLDEDEYLGLQMFLFQFPDSGKVVPGTGGVRKLRWAMQGKGKRGGIRVIYYWKTSENEIWLLTVYGKNERDTIPAYILRQIAEEIRNV